MDNAPRSGLRQKLHEIIFEADTPAGKAFDVVLLILILASVLAVLLESISTFNEEYSLLLTYLEWSFTILFTIEYFLRIYCVRKPLHYITSFYGIVDFLAIIPTYFSIIITGSQYLLVIRGLRLLRIFRIFKLAHFTKEGQMIVRALKASRVKIIVFLFFVLLMVLVIGAVMYLVEGGVNEGFSSIPKSIYWTIVTLTTVGFGDITPQTSLGQFLSAIVMIIGYAVIAVPTGIVSAEMVANHRLHSNTQVCQNCGREGHDDDAVFCKYCGEKINP